MFHTAMQTRQITCLVQFIGLSLRFFYFYLFAFLLGYTLKFHLALALPLEQINTSIRIRKRSWKQEIGKLFF